MFPFGPQAACINDAPWSNKEILFNLPSQESLGVPKPFLIKNDEALAEENTKLFFIAKLWALQDQIRDVSFFTSLSNALLRSLRKPMACHKQFWTRVNKAQKHCFICQQPIEQSPPQKNLSGNRD